MGQADWKHDDALDSDVSDWSLPSDPNEKAVVDGIPTPTWHWA
jgi:hypothetical protein